MFFWNSLAFSMTQVGKKDTEDLSAYCWMRLVLGLVPDSWEVETDPGIWLQNQGFHSWSQTAGRQENAVLDTGTGSRVSYSLC